MPISPHATHQHAGQNHPISPPAQGVCNIGKKGQRRRMMIGISALVLAGALSGFAIAMHVPFVQRLVVFPFFVVGFISLLESQQKVCVLNAYTGKEETE